MALKSKLNVFARGLPKALDKAAEQTAKAVKAERDKLVPIDTGDLLDSGEVLPGEDVGAWLVREGAGLSDARAAFTEYGTARMAAQPHMTPAAERHRGTLADNVAAQLKVLEGKAGV
jgi:hypothetical protein